MIKKNNKILFRNKTKNCIDTNMILYLCEKLD